MAVAKSANLRLKAQYDALADALPEAVSIDLFDGSEVLADENHHWGLSHFHYEDSY